MIEFSVGYSQFSITSSPATSVPKTETCCSKTKMDYLLWGTFAGIAVGYFFHLLGIGIGTWLGGYSQGVYLLINKMWFGVFLGIIFVGLMSKVPREFVVCLLGQGNGIKGITKAALSGILLDLCSHGILLVGMKLYERGASIGQVMAFLISSPWNSLSLTVILIALIGWKWTFLFIILSMGVGIITGLIFDKLVSKNVLPSNPNQTEVPQGFSFFKEAKKGLASTHFGKKLFLEMFKNGAKESGMILKWMFLGVIIASLIRAFVDTESFQAYFGASALGLMFTLILATVVEMCSEGSTPIAADILTRAQAPGNGFVFLMAGVSTDLTEILVLKGATRSWKIPLFLPLVTLPQIVVIGLLLNNF